MNIIKQELQVWIASGENLIYCFEIKLQSGEILHLTSNTYGVSTEKLVFLPNSGLNIVKAEFNDSAKNNIVLSGIFEPESIRYSMDLCDARVRIWIYLNNRLYDFVTYYCSLYTKYDLGFSLLLEPESKKYQISLLKKFSKNCRTDFGDGKCRINTLNYTYKATIIDILDRVLLISELGLENGFFDYGSAKFEDNIVLQKNIFKIIKYMDNKIHLAVEPPEAIKPSQTVKLTAGCDKKFITCCNKFNNEVNFRGEPFLPESGVLEKLNEC